MTYKWYEIFNHTKRQYARFYVYFESPMLWHKNLAELCLTSGWDLREHHITEVIHKCGDNNIETLSIEEFNEPGLPLDCLCESDYRDETDIDFKIKDMWPHDYKQV